MLDMKTKKVWVTQRGEALAEAWRAAIVELPEDLDLDDLSQEQQSELSELFDDAEVVWRHDPSDREIDLETDVIDECEFSENETQEGDTPRVRWMVGEVASA